MNTLSPIEHKVALISQALNMAHDSYSRYFNQVSTLREWTVTLLLGYMGFFLSVKPTNPLTILPFALVLLFFLYLEGDSRARMGALINEMSEIEHIFMESDAAKFTQAVQQFEFRSIKDAKPPQSGTRDRIKKVSYLLRADIILWYLLELLAVIALYLAIGRII